MIPRETDDELRSRLRADVKWFTDRDLTPAGLSFIPDSLEVVIGEALDRIAAMLGKARFEEVPDLGPMPNPEYGRRYQNAEIDILAERLDVLDVVIGETVFGSAPPRGVELDRNQVKQIVAVMTAWLARTEHV